MQKVPYQIFKKFETTTVRNFFIPGNIGEKFVSVLTKYKRFLTIHTFFFRFGIKRPLLFS